MNTKTLQKRVVNDFMGRHHLLAVENIYLFGNFESDVITISKSEMVYEFEIKRTRQDFKADFKKTWKHHSTSNGMGANYFYYVCPFGMIKKDEIPEYAGLIWCGDYGTQQIKTAPRLHNDKLDPKQWRELAIKLFWKKFNV